MMNAMYDTLLQLPLFQGLSKEEFSTILGKMKLHFLKYKADEVIIEEGTLCDRLVFVLKGEIATSTTVQGKEYTFTEYFDAPYLIEPQSLFGLNTSYASTHTAYTPVSVLIVSKTFVLAELSKYPIFRLNFVNMISNRTQTLYRQLWSVMPDTLEKRIRLFMLLHIERASGQKMIKIKMEGLAHILNETRQNISHALNAMQHEGLLELHRGGIVIPEAAALQLP
jgi:CRP-like cAMP-binding protein